MYELPQADDAGQVIINRAVVEGRGKPKIKPVEKAATAATASETKESPTGDSVQMAR